MAEISSGILGGRWVNEESVEILYRSRDKTAGSKLSDSVLMAGFSPHTIALVATGSVESNLQYMNPLSRTSGSSISSVDNLRIRGTNSLPAAGLLMNNFTTAVKSDN